MAPVEERACPRCGRTIYEALPRRPGRPRRWCSARCRRAASEERRAADNGAIGLRHIKVEPTPEQHVDAVLDSPAGCRRVLRELARRDERGHLDGARWDSVRAELDRLRQPRLPPRSQPIWLR